jgi:hypothetical protein
MSATGVFPVYKGDVPHVCRRECVRYSRTVGTKKTKLLPLHPYFTGETFLMGLHVEHLTEINYHKRLQIYMV